MPRLVYAFDADDHDFKHKINRYWWNHVPDGFVLNIGLREMAPHGSYMELVYREGGVDEDIPYVLYRIEGLRLFRYIREDLFLQEDSYSAVRRTARGA